VVEVLLIFREEVTEFNEGGDICIYQSEFGGRHRTQTIIKISH
jgi:hypothetical protein